MIARLFYNDGLVTIFALGGIYAVGTLDFSFNEVMKLGIALNIAAGRFPPAIETITTEEETVEGKAAR